MRERMEKALRSSDAEYADVRIEDVTTSWLTYRGEDLDSIGSSKTLGGIVRALVRGGWGYATFPDLGDLEERVKEMEERFQGGQIPLPPFWGGYRLYHTHVEFWQGRANRLHDRVSFSRHGDGWTRERLYP